MFKIKKYILTLVLAGFGFFGIKSDVKAVFGLECCLFSCGATTLLLGYKTAKLIDQVRVRTLPEVDRSLRAVANILEDAEKPNPTMSIGLLIHNAADAAHTAAHPISTGVSVALQSAGKFFTGVARRVALRKSQSSGVSPADSGAPSSAPAASGEVSEMHIPNAGIATDSLAANWHGGSRDALHEAFEQPIEQGLTQHRD